MINLYNIGNSSTRKWGYWIVLDIGDGYCLKKLVLKNNSSISLQRHKYRSETWLIVSGFGTVTIGNELFSAKPGDVFHIECGTTHRLSSGSEGLVLFELQKGSVLDENDIERFSP